MTQPTRSTATPPTTESTASLFELRNVFKTFPGHQALDDVSLQIDTSRITAVIGPSGCGKSTLLRSLIGLVTPDSGLLRFNGKPLRSLDLERFRQRVGYVIQQGGLFPHLSLRDNVLLMPKMLAWSSTDCDQRIRELAELTQLPSTLLDRYPWQVSGGQAQRVALMRALVLRPDALLLDEPFAGLDPMVRHDLQEDLKQLLAGLGTTVVMVTHDLAEADYLAERIVLMQHGRVVQEGCLRDLETNPTNAFVSRFVAAQRPRAS